MPPWVVDLLMIFLAVLLVVANGFFVAAEFALVKVRSVRIEQMVLERKPFAKAAQWLSDRLESVLSACQLGITIASLALGMIGEPAVAHLLEPLFEAVHITDPTYVHGLSYAIVLPLITVIHLVIGEQAPKIFAIRRPEIMLLWCALPLKLFSIMTYPLMTALNWVTSVLLRRIGLNEGDSHEIPHSEEEIRALISESHLGGHLSRSEHHLINAVFEFDDMVCRRVMLPRTEIDFFDIHAPVDELIALARRTKHTRYPVCDGSLDEVLGIVHVKDLVGLTIDPSFDWTTIMRPPKKVPENMPISKLLRHFQGTHQLMAFVVDEYGTIIGIVTLENVLEQIIGEVADEFDEEQPDFVPEGTDRWLIQGSVAIENLERQLGIEFGEVDADTFSGLLMDKSDRIPEVGDRIALGPYVAEVVEVRDNRAIAIRVTRGSISADSPTTKPGESPAPQAGQSGVP